MNILLMAPHPFYQERGTPMAIKLLLQVLCQAGHKVDLLTYHEGQDVEMEGLHIHRIPRLPLTHNIPIGFSWKKLLCDASLTVKAVQLLRKRQYDIIHAVEESIFIALLVGSVGRAKLVYDMDSSMVDQITEKWPFIGWLRWLLNPFERLAIRRSDAILPVCQALYDKIKPYTANKKVCVLEDIAPSYAEDIGDVEDIRSRLNIEGVLALYIGNLEHYQGIDLALEAFGALGEELTIDFAIIGGTKADIAACSAKADRLGISKNIHFLGPRPVAHSMQYLNQADILVSPRIKGTNTPMKVYAYLASGKPILATNIRSHTQVLDDSCAVLVNPDVPSFVSGLERLIEEPGLGNTLAQAALQKTHSKYTYDAFKNKVLDTYTFLEHSREA